MMIGDSDDDLGTTATLSQGHRSSCRFVYLTLAFNYSFAEAPVTASGVTAPVSLLLSVTATDEELTV